MFSDDVLGSSTVTLAPPALFRRTLLEQSTVSEIAANIIISTPLCQWSDLMALRNSRTTSWAFYVKDYYLYIDSQFNLEGSVKGTFKDNSADYQMKTESLSGLGGIL